jgi:5'-nucleotidase
VLASRSGCSRQFLNRRATPANDPSCPRTGDRFRGGRPRDHLTHLSRQREPKRQDGPRNGRLFGERRSLVVRQSGPQITVLISLFGPVIDLQAGLPHEDLRAFFTEYDKGVVERVTENASVAGFLLELPPTPGALEALRDMGEVRQDVNLVGPTFSAWRECRADMFTWVERHLGGRWAESLILARYRTCVKGTRLLTSYAEARDWAGPSWDVVVLDAANNQELPGVRMNGWADVDGLIGNWLDRIPWKATIWNIIDDSHFGVWVRDCGDGTYQLHVYCEMYDESHSYDAEITDRYWDLGPAAFRPRQAARILLDRVRTWTYRDTEFLGRIESHEAFEWGGRQW